jgi:mRNA-decapping enzyme subunit 2
MRSLSEEAAERDVCVYTSILGASRVVSSNTHHTVMINARDIPPHFYLEDPASSFSPAAGPSSQPYSQSTMEQSYSNPIPMDDEDETEENIFRDMTFDEVLEDLNARFLLNLPKEEMTLVRIYWQAEQA